MPSIDGLASGIDTTTIIDGLLKIQKQRVDQLSSRQRAIRAEQAVFAGVEGRLLSLRGALSNLARSQSNSLSARQVKSSDETILVARGTNRAAIGTYTLKVNQLAQRHQVASNDFGSLTDEITTGTITIQGGGKSPATITIDDSNNSVQGLVDAINAANAGVSASVVQEGNAGSTSYRILLSSSRSGAEYGISLTNDLAASTGDAVQPTFNFASPVQAAQNATVTLGAGAGEITVQSDTNQFDNLIPGVTLDALSANPTKSVTLSVSYDVEKAKSAIQEFVTAYNDLAEFIKGQTQYNSSTGVAGALLGNRSVIGIQSTLQSALTSAIAGLPSSSNRLSALGITVGSDGKLTFNSSRVENILNGQDANVSPDDLQRIFALGATSSNSGISFIVGSSRTKAGTVQIDITSAAQQAKLTATNTLAASTVIDDSNNQLVLSRDGGSDVTISLNHGTYSRTELAQEIQRAINTHPDYRGNPLSVSVVNDALAFTSGNYGNDASITVRSGNSLASLGFDAGATAKGQDVVGKFIVNGVEEKATGRGQILVGDKDNAHTADLQVRVTLKDSQLVSGIDATLTVTRGFAASLDLSLDGFLDSAKGKIKSVNDTYSSRVDSLQASIDRLNRQFDARRESLVKQFVNLETNLSKFQTLGAYLGQQLASLSSLTAR